MTELHLFKWRHFQADIILFCVRWYLRSALSYRDLEEMMLERGLQVDHTTIYRWVQRYAPELERRCRSHLKPTTDSWRVDETDIKLKKQWVYLYRAVDSQGNTLDVFFSPTRNAEAARCFFLKAVAASHTTELRVIGRWTKTRPIPKHSLSEKRKDPSLNTANYDRSSISTT